MFQIGDTVIHPGHGAGKIIGIEKLTSLGSDKLYYSIELSDERKTHIWVSLGDAGQRGVRYPTLKSQLGQIWHVLRAEPETQSTNHKERTELLEAKLRGGDIIQIAEVVRDMFWEDHRSSRLTIMGKKAYDKGLMLLTSEVAATQGCALAAAKTKISDILGTSVAAEPIVG